MDQPSPSLCPACQAALPDTGQFAVWCPACNWNVEAKHSFVNEGVRLDKLIKRVRGRYAERQYPEFVEREPHALRPRRTFDKISQATGKAQPQSRRGRLLATCLI